MEIILIISVELYVETEDADIDLIAYYKCGAGSASCFLVHEKTTTTVVR